MKPKNCIYPDCLNCTLDDCLYNTLEQPDIVQQNKLDKEIAFRNKLEQLEPKQRLYMTECMNRAKKAKLDADDIISQKNIKLARRNIFRLKKARLHKKGISNQKKAKLHKKE